MTAKPRDYQRKHEPFAFTIGPDAYTLPTDLSVKVMAKLAKVETDPESLIAALSDVIDPDTADKITDLPMSDFLELIRDWQREMSGGDRGNSEGSS